MDGVGVPCAKIATIDEVVSNPQLHFRNQIVDVHHPRAGCYQTHGVTVKLGDTPGEIRRPPPLVGEHSGDVLHEWLGVTDAELSDLVEQGVIG
jgi:CoA:oxalate CoA-transferase